MSPPSRWAFVVPAALLMIVGAVLGGMTPAGAAAGDLYAKGIEWCASTYPGHGTLSGFGAPLDLNGKGGVNDLGWPVFAPEDGTVSIYSKVSDGDGWGNSIIWTSADGSEKIHMAHLDGFEETGAVSAGDKIGRVGKTGEASGPHLHVSAQRNGDPAQVELHGKIIHAGQCYVSKGPLPPVCMGRTATILGSSADEELVGTPEDDVIVAGGGADVIRGRGGADVICGGDGKDSINGGAGEDTARGDAGGDVLRGGSDADRLKGWIGPDTLRGEAGADRLLGQAGNDILRGGKGSDRLAGGPGHDTASYTGAAGGVEVDIDAGAATGDGTDTLVTMEGARGSSHPDRLAGDAGSNHLAGGAGDDLLNGRAGQDLLDGGGGDDHCAGGEELLDCED